jgi:protein-tyrosine phosphatase
MSERNGNILFVCTANTCRSPMAAALFRHALAAESEPLRSLTVASAGTSALEGYPAAANADQAMRKVGLTLVGHRSTPLTQEMLDRAFAVFCMTESHRAVIEVQFDRVPPRLFLMRDFMPDGDRDLPDPFGQNLAAYEASRDAMVEAVPSLLAYLRSQLATAAT